MKYGGFVGNPNCGKTTLFNAFTGAKLKVANWPGVTVERDGRQTSYKRRGKSV
ncbi:MAG: FeoB small GTPase domain-containing protein [Clostridium sp.]